jgi:inosine/xanthosine triphosphate pyrophosphatase family protein
MAELDLETKHSLSHRGRALQRLLPMLSHEAAFPA